MCEETTIDERAKIAVRQMRAGRYGMARGGQRAGLLDPSLRLGARRRLGASDGHAEQHRCQLLGGQRGGHLDAVASIGTLVGRGDEDLRCPCVASVLVDYRKRAGGVVRRQ